MEALRKLYELQTIEEKVEKLKLKVKKIEGLIEEKRGFIDSLKMESANRSKELEHLKVELKEKELDLDEVEEHIASLKKTLYSGKGNSRELAGVQKKMQNLTRKKDEKETEVLEFMERLSVQEQAYKEFLRDAEEKRRVAMKEIEEYILKKKELEVHIRHLESDSERIKAGVDERYLSIYMELKSGMKRPLALVKDGTCGGCLIALPIELLKKLKEDKEIVRCNSCGRILILEK